MVLEPKFLFCSKYFLCRTDTIEIWKFDFFRKLCTTISKIDVSSQFFWISRDLYIVNEIEQFLIS